MKILGIRPVTGTPEHGYHFLLNAGTWNSGSLVTVPVEITGGAVYNPESTDPQQYEWRPVLIKYQVWFYKSHAVCFTGGEDLTTEEVALRVKHALLTSQREKARIHREVEVLERAEHFVAAKREPIPDTVRMFVWQRDGGKCVRCGAAEKLEFDHIIPLARGGANTERNIQLLCEDCNRAKSDNI